MRVIAGSAKGHSLKTPKGLYTRPTTDKVKGSLFSMLMGHLADAKVLDLFAGSGGLGIEALSRGAKECVFVDMDSDAVSCIKENLAFTKTKEKARVVQGDSLQFLKTESSPFDLIFIDPPYHHNLGAKSMELIFSQNLLKSGGLVSLETDEGELETEEFEGFELIKSKSYGRISLKIYKKY
ncbi:MAG: 16S rRNA (guanine(966)-N(2))-methyltransferase RsmD [Clostridia bacterium]|nr:16S rRNA (guanine(966)-N(2))-methyltransferase RsmD [Clostridia bacterium]